MGLITELTSVLISLPEQSVVKVVQYNYLTKTAFSLRSKAQVICYIRKKDPEWLLLL